MNGALATTLIGITGGGLLTLHAVFFRMIFTRLDRIEERSDRVYVLAMVQGERLDRIESKLNIDPPAEAA